MARKVEEKGIKIIAKNKRAFHDFEIMETWEAGMVLVGQPGLWGFEECGCFGFGWE